MLQSNRERIFNLRLKLVGGGYDSVPQIGRLKLLSLGNEGVTSI